MLMGVPVCKRLKCVRVNKHVLLVRRTCVANLLKTCNDHDHALICTLQQETPSWQTNNNRNRSTTRLLTLRKGKLMISPDKDALLSLRLIAQGQKKWPESF